MLSVIGGDHQAIAPQMGAYYPAYYKLSHIIQFWGSRAGISLESPGSHRNSNFIQWTTFALSRCFSYWSFDLSLFLK